MSVPVLTACSDASWEADLVSSLDRDELGVVVVRRCVDLADLLATAATGQAQAVILSADLRRLDRDALSRLALAGLAVVGLHAPGDEEAERRLRQLGVATVLPADTPPRQLSDAVTAAVGGRGESALLGAGDPRAALPDLVPPEDPFPLVGEGQVVAVWGPTGAPGRTTLAVGLASEISGLGRSAVLVDADVYGGVVAQVLGLLEESAGIAAACRLAGAGTLDVPSLAGLARQVSPTFRVLTGIARADRWPEVRPAAIEVVLDMARHLAGTTVVDCGFGLEQDEELAYDTLAPRRNGATLALLEQADVVLAVGSADPVGLQRLVRGLAELKEAVPGVEPRVVVNRLRSSAVPGDAAGEVTAALSRYAGVAAPFLVPFDGPGLDAALATGRTLSEAVPDSPARLAIRDLAADLVGVPVRPVRKKGLLRR
jgi:MinD-like ATPase involved in chromosome partitioning or flagellar assembly